jgi:hypothetical protein
MPLVTRGTLTLALRSNFWARYHSAIMVAEYVEIVKFKMSGVVHPGMSWQAMLPN